MIASQVNLTRSLQIVRQVARLGNLCLGPPITKPSEAITSLALDLPFPTFPSWISSHEIDVTCAAWPMTVNPPPRCPPFAQLLQFSLNTVFRKNESVYATKSSVAA
jgi:hypothetical protein